MTTTPNPTAEQVIDRALKDHKGRYHPVNDRTAAFIEDELLYFGLLSEGAPSEEQVERAAVAMRVKSAGFFSIEAWRHLARVGLTAAGVAPQEPTSERCEECGDKLDYVAGLDGQGCYPHCWRCWYKDHPVESAAAAPLDSEKVAEVINAALAAWEGEERSEVFVARSLCEAYKEGKLT